MWHCHVSATLLTTRHQTLLPACVHIWGAVKVLLAVCGEYSFKPVIWYSCCTMPHFLTDDSILANHLITNMQRMLARDKQKQSKWVIAHEPAVISTVLALQLRQPSNIAGSQHAATCKTQRSTDASETNCQRHTCTSSWQKHNSITCSGLNLHVHSTSHSRWFSYNSDTRQQLLHLTD